VNCFAAAVFGSSPLPAFASLPTPRPSAGNGTRNSSSCGPFKVQVGEYGRYQDLTIRPHGANKNGLQIVKTIGTRLTVGAK